MAHSKPLILLKCQTWHWQEFTIVNSTFSKAICMIKVSPRLLSGEICELEVPAQSQTVGEMCAAFAHKYSAPRFSITVAYLGKILPPETPLSSLSFDPDKRPVIFDGSIDVGFRARPSRDSVAPRYSSEFRIVDDQTGNEDVTALCQIGVTSGTLGDRGMSIPGNRFIPDLMDALGMRHFPLRDGPRMFDVELMDIMDEGDSLPSDGFEMDEGDDRPSDPMEMDAEQTWEEEEEEYSDYGDLPRPGLRGGPADNLMNLLRGMRVMTGGPQITRGGFLEMLEDTRDFLENTRDLLETRWERPPPGEGGRDQMAPFAMPEMPEENRREIEELVGMGFDPGLVVQVYEACDRNTEQTLTCLMSMS